MWFSALPGCLSPCIAISRSASSNFSHRPWCSMPCLPYSNLNVLFYFFFYLFLILKRNCSLKLSSKFKQVKTAHLSGPGRGTLWSPLGQLRETQCAAAAAAGGRGVFLDFAIGKKFGGALRLRPRGWSRASTRLRFMCQREKASWQQKTVDMLAYVREW